MSEHPSEPPPPGFRPSVHHGLRVWVRAVIAALSLLVLVGSGVAWATYQGFTASIPHGAPVLPLGRGEQDPDGADQNILLIGNDTRAGATPAELAALHAGHDTTTVNADTMMLLHVPANGSQASIVSFPRDSWVSIPGFGLGKMNASYPDGYNAAVARHEGEVAAESSGIIQVIKTIHALTGLDVDHYMQVSLLGFYRISNAIGGVRVCLNAAQNASTEVGDGGHGNSGIDLPKGVSVIKGTQALAFVRQRHGLPNGDLDRIKRQQYFLKSAFEKITTAGTLLNPFKLHALLGAVGRSLLTDPTLDLLSLGRQMESLTTGKITFATIPNNGPQVIYPDNVMTAIVQVNHAAMPAFVEQLEGKTDKAYTKAVAAAPAAVTLDVLNGTSTARLAARNATALRAKGFHVDVVDSAPQTAKTVVDYPAGREAAAKAVVALVPRARAVLTPGAARVQLVLGGNGVEVPGAEPATSATKPATGPGTGGTGAAAKASDGALGCIN
jgi:LCP family protein required for cell wall assembly